MNSNNNLESEIFCLQFELKTLSDIVFHGKAERWVHGYIYEVNENEHEARYDFASSYVKGKNVLDIACGTGRGSYLLAKKGKANKVLGCDLQEDTIRYAQHRNFHDNVNFEVQNAEEFKINNHFDVIISFETIEHLKNYSQFLENIYQSLKKGGVLIISTPISKIDIDISPKNPYHVQEWGFKKFQSIIEERFKINEIYTQTYYQSILKQNRSITDRIVRKMKRYILPEKKSDGQIKNLQEKAYYELELYNGQYSIEDFGSNRIGYQIIVAEK